MKILQPGSDAANIGNFLFLRLLSCPAGCRTVSFFLHEPLPPEDPPGWFRGLSWLGQMRRQTSGGLSSLLLNAELVTPLEPDVV